MVRCNIFGKKTAKTAVIFSGWCEFKCAGRGTVSSLDLPSGDLTWPWCRRRRGRPRTVWSPRGNRQKWWLRRASRVLSVTELGAIFERFEDQLTNPSPAADQTQENLPPLPYPHTLWAQINTSTAKQETHWLIPLADFCQINISSFSGTINQQKSINSWDRLFRHYAGQKCGLKIWNMFCLKKGLRREV